VVDADSLKHSRAQLGHADLVANAMMRTHRQNADRLPEQFRHRLTQAIVVAFPRSERAALIVPDLSPVEAGIVIAAEINLADVVGVELGGELERLLRRLGREIADRIVGGGEKSARQVLAVMCSPLL
jgi:hypothetical protein